MPNISYISLETIILKDILLRFLKSQDAPIILELQNDKINQQYLHRSGMLSLDEAYLFIKARNEGIAENKWLYWGICKKGSEDIVGTICLWSFSESKLKAEIGYELLPAFQGQGIMTKALKAVLKLGFSSLQLASIEACTNRNNLPSIRLLKKNNFSFVRQLDKKELSKKEQGDELFVYALHASVNK